MIIADGRKLTRVLVASLKGFYPSFYSTSVKLSEWKETGTIYVHWPYCLKRCTFCNFNKYIKKNVNHERMQKCLITEVGTLLKLSEIKKVKSIYFGGGTPSLAQPETIYKFIEEVRSLAELASDAEITIECNPTQLESEKLKEFKKAGVNRVSIGIQSLNDGALNILGRTHSSHDSIQCLVEACSSFPGKVSVDMIFGIPNQTLESWQEELKKIVSICDKHISLYQLTLERGTDLFKSVHRKELVLPETGEVTDMYLFAVEFLESNCFTRYEASNFTQQGSKSKHNISYWNGTQYIGIGPGSHGRFHSPGINTALRDARIQTLEPDVWMSEVECKGHGTRKIVHQSATDILEELLMTSMRTANGLRNERWTLFSDGKSLSDVFGSWPALQKSVQDGFCEFKDGHLIPTKKGITFADSLTLDLLPAIKRCTYEE